MKTRIIAKVNALVDEEVIAALYGASQAGVQVDLIVRGACSLIPGVTGLSKNIRVISVIDRFLEHSRIYYFESEKAMYLSSADWMPRNFYSRLEIAFPVRDPKAFAFIQTVLLPTYLSDNQKARELNQQGTWRKRSSPLRKESRSVRSLFSRRWRLTSMQVRRWSEPIWCIRKAQNSSLRGAEGDEAIFAAVNTIYRRYFAIWERLLPSSPEATPDKSLRSQ